MTDQELNQTTSALTIRQATIDDAQLLAEIGAETFYDAYISDLPARQLAEFVANIFSPELQTVELADPFTFFLIIEVGQATVGYARLQESPPSATLAGTRPLKIPRIYLRQEWIGRGVGSALMKACIAEAVRCGYDTIWLEVWEHNDRALTFYQKWGFEEAGNVTFRFGSNTQTDLVLQRPVSALPQP